jgi:MFS family permease
VASNGRLRAFVRARTLDEYPRGGYRWALLLLTVLASILASYEFQLGPLVPVMLPAIHMSPIFYGFFISAAVLIGGVSATFGGPLADRYGRVVLIDACLGAVSLLVFLNPFIYDRTSFVIVRTLMAVVGGLMAGAGAALVRDMSPRLERALAFAFLTIGPVGANFIAYFIAGKTLPIYHTWQSQFWIMGILAIAMYLPIFFFLKDLSPELRTQIFRSEIAALEAEGRAPRGSEMPSGTFDAFARLLQHYEVWLMVIGIAANLTLYFVIQPFGSLMFMQAFHYTAAEAASMNSYFWAANMLTLIITGVISDRFQIRKPIAILGGVLVCGLLIVWIQSFGSTMPRATVALIASTLGCFLAIGYVPWSAQFSETLEDISPALQATGWAFFALIVRIWLAVTAPMSLYLAQRYGWALWIKISLVGMAIYVVSMVLTRPHGAAQAAPASATAETARA